MRQLKFRAWTKDEMIYEGWNDNFFVNKEIIFRYDDVMEFTGLKDKNGKEIYEGDRCMVNVKEGRIATTITSVQELWEGIGYRDGRGDIKMDLEVIGNIYENAELIKEAEMSQQ